MSINLSGSNSKIAKLNLAFIIEMFKPAKYMSPLAFIHFEGIIILIRVVFRDHYSKFVVRHTIHVHVSSI